MPNKAQVVSLHVYDLSDGMAARVSDALCGIHIDGIWHTGIVAFGREWFFGRGIADCEPGATHYGTPLRVEKLGTTGVTHDDFLAFMQSIEPRYQAEHYHLLDHNCNTFSNEVSMFLTGHGIPAYIANLPAEVLSSPMGAMIRPMIDSMMPRTAGETVLQPATDMVVLLRREPILADAGDPVRAVSRLKQLVAQSGSAAAQALLGESSSAWDGAARMLLEADSACSPEQAHRLLGSLEACVRELQGSAAFVPLDLLAMLLLHGDFRRAVLGGEDGATTLVGLGHVVTSRVMPQPVKIGLMRVLLNLFADEVGVSYALRPAVLEFSCAQVLAHIEASQVWVRLTAASLMFNMALYLPRTLDAASIELLAHAMQIAEHEADADVLVRLVLALGHLTRDNPDAIAMAKSMGLDPRAIYTPQSPAEVRTAWQELLLVLEGTDSLYD